jgi:arsenite oxidase small subunit
MDKPIMSEPQERDVVNDLPVSRRRFLGISCTTLSGGIVAGIAPTITTVAAQALQSENYPVVDVAALDGLKEDTPLPFTYPDAKSPAVLVRLRQPAAGGIGPNNTVVAYSILCTHKGCPVAYRPERKLLICPCHWSSFDPTKGGQIVIGQGSQALPQITLRLNGKMIQAVGVTGLIYGRETNIL